MTFGEWVVGLLKDMATLPLFAGVAATAAGWGLSAKLGWVRKKLRSYSTPGIKMAGFLERHDRWVKYGLRALAGGAVVIGFVYANYTYSMKQVSARPAVDIQGVNRAIEDLTNTVQKLTKTVDDQTVKIAQMTDELTNTKLRVQALELEKKRQAETGAPPPPEQTVSERRLALFLQYAYGWQNYLGSRNVDGDTARVIDPGVPLRTKLGKEPQRLDLGVFNLNPKPVQLVTIRVVFPEGLQVERHTTGHWVQQFGRTFTFTFSEIDNGVGFHNDAPLFIKATKPGSYVVGYSVKARGLNPLVGQFTLVFE